MEKHILTDADGVLVNWLSGFRTFMLDSGYIPNVDKDDTYTLFDKFNITPALEEILVTQYGESEYISNLDPFADSVKYVKKLHDLGFKFTVVTSISDTDVAKQNREKNLSNLFGDVFDEIVCLKMGSSKYTELKRWAGSKYFWIEDHMRQAEAGYEVGLRPILISHPYNIHYQTDLFPKVSHINPWKEIYNIITSDYGING